MKFFNKLVVLIVSMLVVILFLGWNAKVKQNNTTFDRSGVISTDSPPSYQVYSSILKYSKLYGVPHNIAFGVINHETGYRGPLHWGYNFKLTSSANAFGAMQIQVPTANYFSKERITSHDLLNNPDLNIKLSMIILSYLKQKYGSWLLALGAYNTGKPLINSYAINIVNNRNPM